MTLKKYTLIALVVLVAMSISVAPAAAQPAPPHEIYGTVTDQNGDGVSGETVTVSYDGTDLQSTTTDSNGDFVVQVTDPDGQTTGETLTVAVAGNSKTTTFEEFASEQIDFSITVSTGNGGGPSQPAEDGAEDEEEDEETTEEPTEEEKEEPIDQISEPQVADT
jgi:hypothetical protein